MKRIRTLALQSAANIRFLLLPAIWFSLFAYAGRPLVTAAKAAGVAAPLAWGGLVVISMLPLMPLLVLRSEGIRKRSITHWIGYLTLGVFALLLTLVALSDLFRLAVFLAARGPIDGRLMSFAIVIAAATLSLVGLFQARCPRIRRVAIEIEDLPAELEGYKIVQLSDVHVGPTIQRRFVASLVEQANSLDADAIAITGDLVDGYVDDLRDQTAPFRDLRARDGVFYVTGNHEYYWHADEWVEAVNELGFTFLKNEHRVITRGEARISMAGITDPVGRNTHKSDPRKALAGAPRDSVKILLSHRPQAATMADELGVNLQLSGHTHGGQFFPFNYLIRFFQPIVAGLHRVGKTWLYVSRGTGYWGPPSRLGVRGEITLIELRHV